MFTQFLMGTCAGSGMVMGFLGLTYGVGFGHTMALVVTGLSGALIGIAHAFRQRGIG